MGQINSWLQRDRLLLSPFAAQLVEAFKQAEAKQTTHGARPEGKYAHAIDTARYVAWYVDPPTRRRRAPGAGPIVAVGTRR